MTARTQGRTPAPRSHLRRLAVVLALLAAISACGKRVRIELPGAAGRGPMQSLVPEPLSVTPVEGRFVITPATTIVVPRDARVQLLGQYVSDLIGLAASEAPLRVEVADGQPPPASIQLALGGLATAGAEGYELTITPERVTILANEPAGLFYGVQTFRQLLPPFIEHAAVRPDERRPVFAPAGKIVDRPRFAWRGAMLDVARHFLTLDEVKRYIDLLSLHKMNRLHLHLADDQGWRIEITSWPRLAQHGGSTQVGGGPGGYYTQEEYADLVAYAAARFVTIVPEIDMPGHTNAALASYAELNCDGVARPLYTGTEVGFSALCVERDVTYRFIDDVVREIAALTPGEYFHAGGDEVKRLSPAQYVQFIERVQGIVESHGRRMIGWDEVAAARLSPRTVVQHWRPEASPAQAVAQGARVLLSPANRMYMDMQYDADFPIGLNWAAYIEVRDAYDWDPATLHEGLPEASILGVEAPLWTETVANIRDVELLAFPRLAAVAEVGWSTAEQRRWGRFRERLGAQAARWSALGVNFYRSPQVPWP